MTTKYEIFVDAVAHALEDHSFSMKWYFDFDEQDTTAVCRDTGLSPEKGHHVLYIEPIPSWKCFAIMENFIESLSDERIQDKLYSALRQRHPFSSFQDALHYTGVREDWFAFKNERMKYWVERWMQDNGVAFHDDRAVCDHAMVWEDDDEEEGF